MKKLYYKIILFLIFIIIICMPNKVQAVSVAWGTPNEAWEDEEVSIDSISSILSGVNDLAKEASNGDEAAATELLHKMTLLNKYQEKYWWFGEELKNFPEVTKAHNGFNYASPAKRRGITSFYLRRDVSPGNRDYLYMWKKIGNEWTPIIDTAREGHDQIFDCGYYSMIRASLQLGQDSESFPVTHEVYYSRYWIKHPDGISGDIKLYRNNGKNIIQDGYYSGIFFYDNTRKFGWGEHAVYIEAIVANENDPGYAYINSAGYGGGKYHYDGIFRAKDIYSKLSTVNEDYYVVTGGEFESPVTTTEETDSDLGGILLNPFLNVFTSLFDAIQSIATRCMTGEWHWTLVGGSTANNLIETEAYAGQFKGLKIWASNDSSSIVGWPEDVDTSISSNEESSTDNLYREEDGENGDESIDNSSYYINSTGYASTYKYPQILISPEELFSGEIAIVDINFFSTERADSDSVLEEESLTSEKINKNWLKIRNIVQSWFRALRYIGIAALLSVLIYIGIKIMISSTAKDKSKYKDGLSGWAISMVIMVLLPYIMSFIITVSDKIVEIFNNNAEQSITVYSYDGEASSSHQGKMTYTKFTTNLMGLVRYQAQSRNLVKKISYIAMYIMLVIYTIKFCFIYLKRYIYMAFLVIISPIVVVMYAVDNIKGGSPHTFDMWIKEFTFNVLIQPLHMLLYYVLVVSAMSLATTNPIYVIVVLGFIGNAEKILKEIFGFGKAKMGTVGGIADAAKGAITYHNVINTVNNVKGMINKNKTQNIKQVDNKNNSNNENELIDSSNSLNYGRDFSGYDAQSSDNEDKDKEEKQEQSQDEEVPLNNHQQEKNKTEDEQENQDDSNGDQKEKMEEPPVKEEPQQEEEVKTSKFKAATGTLSTMLNRRRQFSAQKFKRKMSSLTPKKAIKGVAKGFGKALTTTAKVATTATVTAGAVLSQAAISLAMDGKYNVLEGVGTAAATAVGTNNLINKGGKTVSGKVSETYAEYKKLTKGKETVKQEEREKAFWKDENNLREYQSLYGDMGDAKLSYELNRGASIAKNGITDTNEQLQVTTFANKMADEAFNSRYSKLGTDEEKQKAVHTKAQELRKNGDKNYSNMTDEDVVKADIIKENKYDKLATNTLKAKKEIPASVRNASSKQRDAWIKGQVADDEKQAEGMRRAIEMTHRMDLAQVDRKQALQKQREQYANLRKSKNK